MDKPGYPGDLGTLVSQELSQIENSFFPISGYPGDLAFAFPSWTAAGACTLEFLARLYWLPGDLMKLWWRVVPVWSTQLDPGDLEVKCNRKNSTHSPRFSGIQGTLATLGPRMEPW